MAGNTFFHMQNIQFWALPVPYELTLKCFLAIKPCASILRFMLLEHTTATLKRKDKLSQISLFLMSVLGFKDACFRSSSLFTSKSFVVQASFFLLIFIYNLLLVQFFLEKTGSLLEWIHSFCFHKLTQSMATD